MNSTRDGRRVRLNLPVEVTVFSDDHTITARSEGRLHDLSRGGCAFYHARNLPVGNRVELRIRLTESLARKMKKSELIAHGVIIRSIPEKSGYLLSVRFVNVARTSRPR